MANAPLHRAEADLLSIATNQVADAFLQNLAESGSDGMSPMVCLLANGMFIYGALGSAEAMADEVDAYYDWALRIAETGVDPDDRPGNWEEIKEKIVGAARRAVDASEDGKRDLLQRLQQEDNDNGFDPKTSPAELTRSWIIQQARPILTLTNVLIVPPTGSAVRLPVMRVLTAHVVGWWIVSDRSDDGTTNVQHPPPGSDNN
jgi:hypothetical protein